MMLQQDGQLSANSLAVPTTGTALIKLSNAGAVLNNGLPLTLHSELTGASAIKDLIFLQGSGVTARIGVQNFPSDGIVIRSRQHDWADDNNQQMMSLGRNVQNLPVLNVGNGIVSCGTVFETSDRDLKENFAEVEPREALAKALSLDVSTWNFKGDSSARHMGPMAQDFHAAFGLGPDEKHIATRDLASVALVAIQGLNQKVEEQRAQLKQRLTEIAELKRRLEKLEQLFSGELNGSAE
jgi:hypothetical protein